MKEIRQITTLKALNKIIKLFNTIERSIVRLFYFLMFSLGATIFFGAMNHYLQRKDYLYLGGLCFPVLAILFGFTSLLYNRSRALQPGAAQRRSLYAAERGLQATLLFMVGIASGAIIATITEFLKIDTSNTPEVPKTLLVYFAPIMLTLYSFSAFFFALRAVSHRTVRLVNIRTLARMVR
ncbi:hypothetical protein [Pseudomonas chlororaphis]|uniref:hypothetical protein n=1 Tax=Pseudomonas chlororaphis TaxID=587753 RepID=UPI000F57064F|nr:hypothetical protein [Pseudomonas chlororaphis]MBP5070172.1 hypothetical protein [Pseudomonas chlororaphis]WDG90005.1 hypothetical protein PUP49_22315 [Pseudomonas chlororaphis]